MLFEQRSGWVNIQEAGCLKACSLGLNLDITEAGELCDMLWIHIYHLSAKGQKCNMIYNKVQEQKYYKSTQLHGFGPSENEKRIKFGTISSYMSGREDARMLINTIQLGNS